MWNGAAGFILKIPNVVARMCNDCKGLARPRSVTEDIEFHWAVVL